MLKLIMLVLRVSLQGFILILNFKKLMRQIGNKSL